MLIISIINCTVVLNAEFYRKSTKAMQCTIAVINGPNVLSVFLILIPTNPSKNCTIIIPTEVTIIISFEKIKIGIIETHNKATLREDVYKALILLFSLPFIMASKENPKLTTAQIGRAHV